MPFIKKSSPGNSSRNLTATITDELKRLEQHHTDSMSTNNDEEEIPKCLFCFTEFQDEFSLQAHLATQKHFSFNQMLTDGFAVLPKARCIVCDDDVNLMMEIDHRCAGIVARMARRTEKTVFCYGNPLNCILCSGKRLYSYYHLLIHVMVRHGLEGKIVKNGKNPCPLCKSLFNTDKRVMIEYHAVKEHMPEIYMEYLKEMQPEGTTVALTKSTLPCKIPSHIYDRSLTKGRKKKNCGEQFPYLTELISHLQSMHSPIPNRPLKHPLGPYACRHCLVSFADSSLLREHVQRKHDLLNRQQANYCKSQDKLQRTLSDLTCKFCWHKFKNHFHLQVHIQASHMGSWRQCGLCGREYCKSNEVRAAKLIYMEMTAHERHHTSKLIEHARRMYNISEGLMLPFIKPPPEDTTDKYFGRINLDAARNRRVKEKTNYTPQFEDIGYRNKQIQEEMILMGNLIE